jgi:chromosome partitioning protein
MNPPIIAFFNNKGGIGKTSLVYHLSWMYVELGLNVIAADLDPQANLTGAFLDENRLEEIWEEIGNDCYNTIFRCVKPLLSGTGDVQIPAMETIEESRLSLVVGDLQLSGFEDELSSQWSDCLDRKERAFRVISAFWRVLSQAARVNEADVVLVDLGPNLGAINRAALIASDYVVVPLSPDLFSLQGLRNLGPTLDRWRIEWQERVTKNPAQSLLLPQGRMQPVGYVILQHGVRYDRPVKAYQRFIAQIPKIYNEEVLSPADRSMTVDDIDSNRLALLKHYQSLMPMAQEAHKPIFYLKPADGAIGAHVAAVQKVYGDFSELAKKIADRTGLILPSI